MERTTDSAAYAAAQRHVNRKIGFFIHLGIYLAVNTALVIVNLTWLSRVPFSIAPLLGWGIGLLFHGLSVFLHAPGAAWKQRMIDKELGKIPPAR